MASCAVVDSLGSHPEYGPLLAKLKAADGSWAKRDDVTIAWANKERKHGPLTVGWGYRDDEIGPELLFGTLMGELYDEHVLLIKTAWCGKDVYCDFRSPSAGPPTGPTKAMVADELATKPMRKGRELGNSYRLMIAEIQATLGNLEEVVPGYAGQGYELAGMARFQGWNDYCQTHDNPGFAEQYSEYLAAMIHDLRKDLGAPKLPVAIGELGVGGKAIEARAKRTGDRIANNMVGFRLAQKVVADNKDLAGVRFVPTAVYWDDRLEELRRQADAYRLHKKAEGISNSKDLADEALSAEYRS